MDLTSPRLQPGDVRHERLRVHLDPLEIGGQTYTVEPPDIEAVLDAQAASSGLYLKLAFKARVEGPCFRCLEPADVNLNVRVFALPDKILDRPDCAGLCPHCGERLESGVEHDCGNAELDSRWAKLRDLL